MTIVFFTFGVHCGGWRPPTSARCPASSSLTPSAWDHLELFLMPDGRQQILPFLCWPPAGLPGTTCGGRSATRIGTLAYTAAAAVVSNGWEAEWAIPLYVLGDGRLADDFPLEYLPRPADRAAGADHLVSAGRKAAREFHDPDNFVRVDLTPARLPWAEYLRRGLSARLFAAPYRACSDGGFEYDLALALENQGANTGSVKLVVVHQARIGSASVVAWAHVRPPLVPRIMPLT